MERVNTLKVVELVRELAHNADEIARLRLELRITRVVGAVMVVLAMWLHY